ncbi:spore coat protein U-like protein [Deinococcus metalli]|uniref:Spore coat protein U-like protein n=1 Tax=Deinococcus metalli TaxID=1141878 RepID=A0A7W8NMT0_9DEIO|nr:spore coat protein U domain-containing protein [Deinococcus metalli]MBB5376144.1 spore coat protein U-like protein [Deinococcus metalli]GHF40468.1 hypothetical protein GCM10017781_16370 [Deinococcus metalli]
MPLNPLKTGARRHAAFLLLLCAVGGAGASQCTLQSPDLNLGTYTTPSTLDTLAGGRVTVACIKTLGDALGLDLLLTFTVSVDGTASAATPRTLGGPSGSTLAYLLTTVPPAGTGKVWGTGAGGTEVMTGQALLPAVLSLVSAQPVAVPLLYQARIPAGQTVRAGAYTGTLTVTLNF